MFERSSNTLKFVHSPNHPPPKKNSPRCPLKVFSGKTTQNVYTLQPPCPASSNQYFPFAVMGNTTTEAVMWGKIIGKKLFFCIGPLTIHVTLETTVMVPQQYRWKQTLRAIMLFCYSYRNWYFVATQLDKYIEIVQKNFLYPWTAFFAQEIHDTGISDLSYLL